MYNEGLSKEEDDYRFGFAVPKELLRLQTSFTNELFRIYHEAWGWAVEKKDFCRFRAELHGMEPFRTEWYALRREEGWDDLGYPTSRRKFNVRRGSSSAVICVLTECRLRWVLWTN